MRGSEGGLPPPHTQLIQCDDENRKKMLFFILRPFNLRKLPENHAGSFAVVLHILSACHVCENFSSKVPVKSLSALKVLLETVFFMLGLYHPYYFVASIFVFFFGTGVS